MKRAKRSKANQGNLEIKQLRADISSIYKTIYQGNGKPSIITQLSSLENRLNSLNSEIELKFKNVTDVVNEKFNSISYQIKQEFDKRKIDAAGIWNFKVALTTSILASLTSVFVVLLSELIKKITS